MLRNFLCWIAACRVSSASWRQGGFNMINNVITNNNHHRHNNNNNNNNRVAMFILTTVLGFRFRVLNPKP